jgi:hypothetical protein
MHPLRTLLSKDATLKGLFPPNEEQRRAIDELKTLVVEDHLLAVPDERAAIMAANAWSRGEPAAGLPYEGGVDTSKIAAGGVLGQAECKDGRLRILMYWSMPLTPAQSQWHPFEQEFFGALHFKREVVKHFGRIPIVIHTDHGTITRLEYLPLDRIEAKHYRWHAELTQGGTLSLYRPGCGALHKLPDALSRNPPLRDALNLSRIGDWTQIRATIRGVQQEIDDGLLTQEDPPVFDIKDLGELDSETLLPQGATVADLPALADSGIYASRAAAERKDKVKAIAEMISELGESPVGVRKQTILYLPPYAVPEIAEKWRASCRVAAQGWVGGKVRMLESAPPYEDDSPEPVAYWFRPYAKDKDARRKLLRKQLFAGLVSVLHACAKHRPAAIVGAEQGGILALMCSKPLVLEAALRARIVTSHEMVEIRKAWVGVVGVFGINPIVLAQRSKMEEVLEALPELIMPQPQGIMRVALFQPGSSRSLHKAFLEDLACQLGTVPMEFNGFEESNPLILAEFRRLLALPLPVSFEDDPTCLGTCAVCGKRGAFARCNDCGLLLHVSCFTNIGTSDGRYKCPACVKGISEDDDDGSLIRARFAKGVLTTPLRVGRELGLDPRPSCSLEERPNDVEAQEAGFADAREWIADSVGGHLIAPAVMEAQLRELAHRETQPEGGEQADNMQWWRHLQGVRPGASELIEALTDSGRCVSTKSSIEMLYGTGCG